MPCIIASIDPDLKCLSNVKHKKFKATIGIIPIFYSNHTKQFRHARGER